MSINIDFTSMTFDEIKESLKSSLRDDGIITDFDYEGSNTDTLLNIMAYVTTLINHNINYMSNEAFLNTARNRKNILKHAQALNYKVERKVSANINGMLSFYLGGKRQITIPKNTPFYTPDGTVFITTEDYVFANSTDVTSLYEKSITLKEGRIINSKTDSSLAFTFDKNKHSVLTLPYKDIENAGIKIYCNKGTSSERVFSETLNIMDDILKQADTFLVEFDPETEYVRIKILTKYGMSPNDNDNIEIELLISKGAKGNNYKRILPITLYDSSTNVNITSTNEIQINFNVNTQDYSYGGADEESNEEIITYAPLAKSTGNRFITSLDWNAGLVNLPQVSFSNVWGGDEIGTDLVLTGFSTFQKEALKQRGTVFMTAVPSSGDSYFSVNTIEDIKNMLRENSVVSLKKRFMQPIEVGVDLNINISKEDVVNVTDEYIIAEVLKMTNSYFYNPLNLQYKKAKIINELYSIEGVDAINLNGSKINFSISGYNFYDDSEDFLDITLPVSKTNQPININKISSSEPFLYDFSLIDIPDGITEINKYIYDSRIDNFLDHIGVQLMNYFVWSDTKEYSLNDVIMYPDRETGKIYLSKTNSLNQQPSGTTSDTEYWKYIPMTSKYMDKYGLPINFDKYKRIRLVQKQGIEFVALSGDYSDYYSENELIWKYNSSEDKIEYYLSKQNNNTNENLSDEDFWEKIELDSSIVAEDELLIGVYMKEENILRLPNAQPRKLSIDISVSDTFAVQTDFDNLTTKGIATYYKRGNVISVAGIPYICRFDIDCPLWSSSATYVIGNIVFDGTNFWKSLANANTSALREGTKWTKILDYNSGTSYNEGEFVKYGNECYRCLSTGIVGKVPTITRLWKKLVKSKNPILDVNKNVWVVYKNTTRFNMDIFNSNINNTLNISSSKRTFYIDDITGLDNFDSDNLRFKRELKTSIRNRTITFVS